MGMTNTVKRKLAEAEKHILPYIRQEKCLREMCKRCEQFCGKEHDYSECKNMWCYKFFLAYTYLEWESNYEDSPEAMGR